MHYLIDSSFSFKGLWQIPLVMWNDLGNGRCSMLDACSNPNNPEDVFKLLWTNFARHYNTNRAPIGTYFFLSCTSSTYLDSLLMADKAKLLLLKLIHLSICQRSFISKKSWKSRKLVFDFQN